MELLAGQVQEFSPLLIIRRIGSDLARRLSGGAVDELQNEGTPSDDAGAPREKVPSYNILKALQMSLPALQNEPRGEPTSSTELFPLGELPKSQRK